MKLTPDDVRQLQAVRQMRDTPPTIGRLLRRSARPLLLVTVLCLAAAAVYFWLGWRFASGTFFGMLIGTVARDFGWFRKLVRTWPLSKEITHWQRVDELLETTD